MARKKLSDATTPVNMRSDQFADLMSGNLDALLTPKGAQELLDKGYGGDNPEFKAHLEDVIAGRADLRMRVKEYLDGGNVKLDLEVVPKQRGLAFGLKRAPAVEQELDTMHEVGAGTVPLSFAKHAMSYAERGGGEMAAPEEWGKTDAINRRYPETAKRFKNGMYMPPWTGEEGSWSKHANPAAHPDDTYLITPRRLKPAGLPHVREVLLFNLNDEKTRSPKPLPIAAPEQWGMYYASAEFTSLLEQMQQDAGMTEDVLTYWQDVVNEQGVTGQFVVAFDPTRLPWLRFANTKDMIMSDAWQRDIDDDPFIERTDDVYVLRAQVQAITVQWRMKRVLAAEPKVGGLSPMEVDLYFGIYTRGHTFRTAVNGSYTSRDAILIAWMLTNPLLRMLESKQVKAGAGLPPKVKAAMPRAHRESPVTVVSLRHAVRQQVREVEAASAKSREYRHRFLVRGHWRNQACGKGWQEHRRVYVLPYVKGPDGAPFTRKEKVLKW